MTAVALGLPIVRAANTGISVVTDAYGRELDALALGATGTIETALPRAAAATIYAKWGDLPFFSAIVHNICLDDQFRLRIAARVS